MRIRFPDIFILAGIVAAIAMAGCSGGEKGRAERPPVARGLSLETVQAVALPELYEVSGTVKAKNTAQLSARIPGLVMAVHAREGDRVRKGQVLVELEAGESAAGAAGARQAVAEAAARKQLADVTLERFDRLYREQAVTRQELDTRRAEKEMADRALARAREEARAAATTAGYSRLVSPISGVVTSRAADRGSTVFPGMPLVTVEEAGQYRLEAAVPESLLSKVVLGAAVPVAIDGAAPDLEGKVVEIVPRVDPASRTFTVKLAIPAAGVRSGSFGRARLTVGERRGLLVPAKAVLERGQLTMVWVVDGGNTVRMRLVKPGKARGDRVEILAGLAAGERIVTGGMERVREGAKVE